MHVKLSASLCAQRHYNSQISYYINASMTIMVLHCKPKYAVYIKVYLGMEYYMKVNQQKYPYSDSWCKVGIK